MPPKHILNAPTKLMKARGLRRRLRLRPRRAGGASPARTTFPKSIGRQQFYDPLERGFEREIRKRLEYWAKLRKDRTT